MAGRALYDARVPYAFGGKIAIGDWTIDTGELPRHGSDENRRSSRRPRRPAPPSTRATVCRLHARPMPSSSAGPAHGD